MVVVPTPIVAAVPAGGVEALEIVATASEPVLHVTTVVMSWVDESEYVPVALNCCGAPSDTFGEGGVMPIERRTAAVTVKVAVPEMLPKVAVTVAGPRGSIAVARPFDPVALDTTSPGDEEVHMTAAV